MQSVISVSPVLLILGEQSAFFLLYTIAMQHHFVLGSYSSNTLLFSEYIHIYSHIYTLSYCHYCADGLRNVLGGLCIDVNIYLFHEIPFLLSQLK